MAAIKFDAYSILESLPPEITENFLYADKQYYVYSPYNQFNNTHIYGIWKETPIEYMEKKMSDFYHHPKKNQTGELLHAFRMLYLINEYRKLNENKDLIGLKNGVFNIKTGDFTMHKRENYLTFQLPINYDNDAICPRFEQFLFEVLESQEDISIMQEYIGLCFTTITKFEKCLICVGSGGNGKSTLLDTISLLFANNISYVPLGKFDSDYHRAMLKDKLVNISNESDVSELMKTDYFKGIVSGNMIEARRPYFDPFSFQPFCKLIFSMNELPRIKDKSHATQRRLIIINFLKEFNESNRDNNLKDTLKTELQGIFIWAMVGLKRLLANNAFTKSKTSEKALNTFLYENNPVAQFLKEKMVQDNDAMTLKNNTYEIYKQYCFESGYKAYSKNIFFRELKRFKYDINNDSDYIKGLKIKE